MKTALDRARDSTPSQILVFRFETNPERPPVEMKRFCDFKYRASISARVQRSLEMSFRND